MFALLALAIALLADGAEGEQFCNPSSVHDDPVSRAARATIPPAGTAAPHKLELLSKTCYLFAALVYGRWCMGASREQTC